MTVRAASSGSEVVSNRVLAFDFIRCVACFAVIVLHAKHSFVGEAALSPAWNVATLCRSFARPAVPLFVAIGGYFLLSKAYVGSEIARFYRRRFSKIGVPFAFWATFYFIANVAQERLRGASFDAIFAEHFAAILRNGHGYGYHLWYLYALVGLYAATPLIATWFDAFSRRALVVATSVLTLVVGAASASSLWLDGRCGPPTIFIAFFYYLPYFLWGKILGDFALASARPFLTAVSFVVFLVSTFAAFGTQVCWGDPNFFYANSAGGASTPLVFFQALSFYVFALSWRSNPTLKRPKALALLASLSFGVYLVHLCCYDAARLLLAPLALTPAVERPATTFAAYVVATYALANAATFVLKRIPYLRRVV